MFLPKMTDLGLLDGGITQMIDTDEAGNIKQKSVEHQWVLRIKKRVTLIKCLKKRHYPTLNFRFGNFPDGKMKIVSILGSSLK